ncbi:hypothetical protein RG963_02640 [Methanosarcina sp. Z-7115]|uniref:Uncharacterized protein n=1 Tax=Methanosarcina baikalica TaxID=3073890 RepID=A0ABU2CY78_9EURY|nr:hypothetical protein [Methanosarcina sp. Z-7115]MDR7664702.1 hypothetical protein [Methanosarcina sp. Z-7115]
MDLVNFGINMLSIKNMVLMACFPEIIPIFIVAFYYYGSAEGHEYPDLYRLSDNSISGQKHVKNKAYKAFKLKKTEPVYYWK